MIGSPETITDVVKNVLKSPSWFSSWELKSWAYGLFLTVCKSLGIISNICFVWVSYPSFSVLYLLNPYNRFSEIDLAFSI